MERPASNGLRFERRALGWRHQAGRGICCVCKVKAEREALDARKVACGMNGSLVEMPHLAATHVEDFVLLGVEALWVGTQRHQDPHGRIDVLESVPVRD